MFGGVFFASAFFGGNGTETGGGGGGPGAGSMALLGVGR